MVSIVYVVSLIHCIVFEQPRMKFNNSIQSFEKCWLRIFISILKPDEVRI